MNPKLQKIFTVDPFKEMNQSIPGEVCNLVKGKWVQGKTFRKDIPDPLNGEDFLNVPDTLEYNEFIDNLDICPKSGLHNPLKNVERYLMLGEVCTKTAELLREDEVAEYFAKLIQRVMPKSDSQCLGEVTVTRVFFENFSGDNVRFLARSFSNPGDHLGQESSGYRWPFGSVCIIAPFNLSLIHI